MPNPQPPDRGVESNLLQDKRSWFTRVSNESDLYASNESMTDEHNVCGLRVHTHGWPFGVDGGMLKDVCVCVALSGNRQSNRQKW